MEPCGVETKMAMVWGMTMEFPEAGAGTLAFLHSYEHVAS